jgi:hypothetical protein
VLASLPVLKPSSLALSGPEVSLVSFASRGPLLTLVLGAAEVTTSPSFADTVPITSTSPEAIVEIDGMTHRKGSLRSYPGGYFHRTLTIFGKQPVYRMRLKISLDGFLPLAQEIADGPYRTGGIQFRAAIRSSTTW